jgi:hypothetical protein
MDREVSKETIRMVLRDLAKISIGLFVSVFLVFLIKILAA